MDGAQAIFAFHGFDGIMTTFTSPVTYDMSSEFSNSVMIIYATIEVPDNRTRVNHVWQASDIFSNGLPAIHATSGRNVQSKATLNLLSGQSSSVGNSRMHRKNVSNSEELEEMKHMTGRRKSSGFSYDASIYCGVTRSALKDCKP